MQKISEIKNVGELHYKQIRGGPAVGSPKPPRRGNKQGGTYDSFFAKGKGKRGEETKIDFYA